jgi:hypothetical protein
LAAGVELRGGSRNNELRDVLITGAGASGLDVSLDAGNDDNLLHGITAQTCALTGVHLRGTGNVLVNVTTEGGGNGTGGYAGVHIGMGNNRIYGLRVTNHSGYGLYLFDANNIVVGASVFNNNFGGIREWAADGNESATHSNTFVDVVAVGQAQDGVVIQKGYRSTYAHVTALNNASSGVALGFSGISANHTLVSVLSANATVAVSNGESGSSSGHRFVDLAATYGTFKNVQLGNSGHFVAGELWVSGASLNCEVGGATNRGLVQDTCTDTGDEGSSAYATITPASEAVLHINVDLATSIVGKVTADDTANLADASGSASFAAVTDWSAFENRWRGWGLDGGAFPAADHQGRCTSGTCRIWDARLRSSDVRLRNVFGAFTPGAACPASVSGPTQKVVIDQRTTPNTFLANAIERVLDDSGDDDGLCESSEACVFAPNLGSYQGEGALATCIFSGGIITGVTMYGYTQNGAP